MIKAPPPNDTLLLSPADYAKCKKMRRPGVAEKAVADPDHQPDFYAISDMFFLPEKPNDERFLLKFTLQGGPKARAPVHYNAMNESVISPHCSKDNRLSTESKIICSKNNRSSTETKIMPQNVASDSPNDITQSAAIDTKYKTRDMRSISQESNGVQGNDTTSPINHPANQFSLPSSNPIHKSCERTAVMHHVFNKF